MNLLLYGLVALAILGTLGGIGYKIREAGADSVRAELQPKLIACEGQIKTLAVQITTQNEAVDKLKAASDIATAKAAKGLAAVKDRTKVLETQAEELKQLARSKGDSCQDVKSAVQEVRKDFK